LIGTIYCYNLNLNSKFNLLNYLIKILKARIYIYIPTQKNGNHDIQHKGQRPFKVTNFKKRAEVKKRRTKIKLYFEVYKRKKYHKK